MKKIGTIKLNIQAGKALAKPPISSSLGQKGLNIIDFCKKFNFDTENIDKTLILSVKIFYYYDNSYIFSYKKSSISFYINKNINDKVLLNIKILKLILFEKILDFNTENFYFSFKSIIGTLNSMHFKF